MTFDVVALLDEEFAEGTERVRRSRLGRLLDFIMKSQQE